MEELSQNIPEPVNNDLNIDTYVIPPEEKAKCLALLKMFQFEGQTFDEVITQGQLKIFHALVFRPATRVQIIASTQYGKSLIVALACIIISCIQEEIISVVAPTTEKAKIIMRYYIEHLGDDILFSDKLESNTRLERLKQEENKDRIILRNKGGIFVVSAQSRTATKSIEAAMGLGSKIVLTDESCLIPDNTEATIFRMIAGKGADAFYCKIGNPFYRITPYLHFWKTWNDPNYVKIFIDYKQGIREGRYTEEFIEEARTKPLFDILFECKFPRPDTMDMKGWLPLLSEEDIARAFLEGGQPFGNKRLGCDVAGGGRNYSVMVMRSYNVAKKVYKSRDPDTMLFTGNILTTASSLGVKDADIYIDSVGIGKGAYDRLREQKDRVVGVMGQDKPTDEAKFLNKRAEMFWRLRNWILQGGKLERDTDWLQLTNIKYKVVDSSGRLKIMSKEEMLKDGIDSPDVADSLALTFADSEPLPEGEQDFRTEEVKVDPYD